MKDEIIQELKLEGVNKKDVEELFAISKKLSKLSEIKLSENYKKALLEKFKENASKKSWHHRPAFFAPILVLVLFLLVSFTTIASAQKSLPGDPLYPVKRISEDIAVKLNPDFKKQIVTRRAEEVKSLVNDKKNPSVLNNAIKDYKEAVENNEGKNEIKKEDNNRKLQEVKENELEKRDPEVEKIIKQVESKKEEIKKDNGDKDVKGEKTEMKKFNEIKNKEQND